MPYIGDLEDFVNAIKEYTLSQKGKDSRKFLNLGKVEHCSTLNGCGLNDLTHRSSLLGNDSRSSPAIDTLCLSASVKIAHFHKQTKSDYLVLQPC